MASAAEMDLTELPEIGKVTARQLRDVGITTPDKLREIGAKEAFLRIRRQLDSGACVQLLMGLWAAVEGVSVKDLTTGTKAELSLWRKNLA